MHLHGSLKNDQIDFCKKETLSSEREVQKHVPEDRHQCSCCAEYEVSSKKQIGLCFRIRTGKTKFLQCRADVMDTVGIDYLFDGIKHRQP